MKKLWIIVMALAVVATVLHIIPIRTVRIDAAAAQAAVSTWWAQHAEDHRLEKAGQWLEIMTPRVRFEKDRTVVRQDFRGHLQYKGIDRDITGEIVLSVGGRYEGGSQAVYATDPQLEELRVDGLPDFLAGPAKMAVNKIFGKMVVEGLNEMPLLYLAEEPRTAQLPWYLHVRSVTVEDGVLSIAIGLL